MTLAERAERARGSVAPASYIAAPVLERAGGTGVVRGADTGVVRAAGTGIVRGAGRAAAYVDFDGFVVALTAPGVALMPNGIAVGIHPDELEWARRGARVSAAPGRLGDVGWDAECPPVWEARLCLGLCARGADVRARGAAILAACGVEPEADPVALAGSVGARGVGDDPKAMALLLGSVGGRDPVRAAAAGELLVGRGPGLTPEGDDLVAATAGVVSALGSWSESERRAWREAVLGCGLRSCTTSLSATLIELAAAGDVIEPVHGLFGGGEGTWRAALRRLLGIGGSTGAAYAVAAGAAAFLGAA
ncbi:MAG TPA: DUF2877 domain-containing protein [Solirubrobacteraceae bacterium]|jgi:hypothetical protein|nr:DUF2877 domain-containing protein [Solirubrobacteraceae bacterium]